MHEIMNAKIKEYKIKKKLNVSKEVTQKGKNEDECGMATLGKLVSKINNQVGGGSKGKRKKKKKKKKKTERKNLWNLG